MSIKSARLGSICTRRDDRLGTAGRDDVDQGLGVIGFVGSNSLSLDALKQGFCFGHVGRLSGGKAPASEVAEGFDQGMDLCCQAATGASKRLISFFYWAPAAG